MAGAERGDGAGRDGGALKEATERARTELGAVREEVRLKLHLLEMDARDAWEQIVAPQLETIEQRLEDAGRQAQGRAEHALDERARLQLHLALMEARDRWRELEPYVEGALSRVRQTGEKALDALARLPGDRVRLQATLAKMDAADAIEERRQGIERTLAEGRDKAADLTRRAVEGLRETFRSIRPGG